MVHELLICVCMYVVVQMIVVTWCVQVCVAWFRCDSVLVQLWFSRAQRGSDVVQYWFRYG